MLACKSRDLDWRRTKQEWNYEFACKKRFVKKNWDFVNHVKKSLNFCRTFEDWTIVVEIVCSYENPRVSKLTRTQIRNLIRDLTNIKLKLNLFSNSLLILYSYGHNHFVDKIWLSIDLVTFNYSYIAIFQSKMKSERLIIFNMA